jgi:iron complex transport system permease protein
MLISFRAWFYPLFALLSFSLFIASLGLGAMSIHPFDIFSSLMGLFGHLSDVKNADVVQFLILEVRLPRTVTAMLVGASLAASGVVMQGLFRNPLADPTLIGVSAGASFGAVSAIVLLSGFGAVLVSYLLPIGAFTGGMLATFLVYRVATRFGQTDTALLLLGGIAIGAVASAGIGTLSYFANDAELRDLTLWSMGSVSKTQWLNILLASPVLIISMAILFRYRSILNAMSMGEHVAYQMGHDVKRIKKILLILTALIVSVSVSISGIILFIGLVVPHLLRMLVGADHKHLLPLSMLAGAALLLVADIISRFVVAPAELPVGLVMSLIGSPFFILLLVQQKRASS